VGDGGFTMVIGEIAIAILYNLPVEKITFHGKINWRKFREIIHIFVLEKRLILVHLRHFQIVHPWF
jgi:hypothetical protein